MTLRSDPSAPIDKPEPPAMDPVLKELADLKFALDESAIVAITDPQGVITYVNDTFCKISKYARHELLGKTHRVINAGYHPSSFFGELWSTITHGRVWKGEIRNRAKDGSFYWVDTTIVPFLGADGTPYQYVSIRKEITSRKRVEQEIRQLNEEMEQRILQRTAELEEANQRLTETLEQLQEAEKLRSTFISALTHDLRTPLVAQQRAFEIFLKSKDALPPKLAGLSERLLKSTDDLLHMVNTMLETYQYEAGKTRLNLEPLPLAALVSDCFAALSPLAETRRIRLINWIPTDLGDIMADAHQLRRVFRNLVGNALENIPSGSEIRVSAARMDGDIIEIQVRDNGPGIAPELLAHLFERYFTGDRIRQKIGTGLGLYICKMIMTLHQGAIEVESTLGQGTTFYLTLPTHCKHEEIGCDEHP